MSAGDTESPPPEVKAASKEDGGTGNNGSSGSPSRHASITELELQFAQNPKSTAYIALCEAYLEQGRFMEAMVVCKKGIKAHPDSVEAKILLAQVYARQKKYKRALQELDALVEAVPDDASARLARGRLHKESGETDAAVEDLKRSVDLDGAQEEASRLLAELGVVYPEPEPEPEPVAPPARPASGVTVGPISDLGGTADTGDLTPGAPGRPVSSVGPAPPAGPTTPAQNTPLPRSGSHFAPPPGVEPGAPYQIMPQQLEGEDELEKLAQRVAEEKPARGRPKTTLLLLVAMVLVSTGLITWRVVKKNTIENIDRLTTAAVPLFNRDTYGGYKQAAELFEEIIDDNDANHPLTLGRLAHTYAILWGEHGERDLKPKLDDILGRAMKHAPEVSHTVAAHGLAELYGGQDRQEAARDAMKVVAPLVQKAKAGGAAPTHADLTQGIIELDLGEYDEANARLANVKQVLPGSVRAKVWHARAAYRAGRLNTAASAYSAALRAEPQHPGARAGLALTRLRAGNLEGAAKDLQAFDELAREHPKDVSRKDNALAEFARSEVFRAAGEDGKATGAYEQAVRLDPDNADFPFGLGRWLLRHNRYGDALEPLRKAVQMDPNRWLFLVELAEAEMFNRNFEEAEELIEKAEGKAPTQVEVDLARARLMRRTKRPGAEAYIRGLIEEHPSAKVDVHLELGRYYRAQDQFAKAKDAYETAINAMSSEANNKQAEVLLSYGKLMDDMGTEVVALNSYKQAARMGELEGWYLAAIKLAQAGNRGEAKKACRRYLEAGKSLRYSEDAQKLCDSL